MLTQPRRLVSAALAIVLGVTFVAVALFLGNAIRSSTEQRVVGDLADAGVVITRKKQERGPTGPAISDTYVAAVRSLPGVTGTRVLSERIFFQDMGGHRSPTSVRTVLPQGIGTVTSGRLPEKPGEVAVTSALAAARGVREGNDLRIGHGFDAPTVRAHVVGVVDPGPNGTSSPLPTLFAASSDIAAWSGEPGADEVQVIAPDVDVKSLRTRTSALPGGGAFTIRTKADEAEYRVGQAKTAVETTKKLFLGFAAVSVVVSAIVIANTFSILVLQQVRELALLRCVGARRRQVFGLVLREALFLSFVASAAGVILGAGIVAVVSALSAGSSTELGWQWVSPAAVALPMSLGMVVTTLAAVVPAHRATRVAPMAALRPEFVSPVRSRSGRIRTFLGFLTFLGGTSALVVGAASSKLVPAMIGGGLSVIGIVMVGGVIVPPLAGLLGALPARVAGLPGQLAVDNSRRNPARAGATASALFVGVALITMMSVGAESGQASLSQEFDRRASVDALITSEEKLPEGVFEKIRHSPVVAAAAQQSTGQVTLTSADPARTFEIKAEAQGLGPGADQVIRYRGFVEGVGPDTVLLSSERHRGVPDGAKVTVTGPRGDTLTVRAVVREGGPGSPMLTADNLRKVNPSSRQAIAVRLADGQDPAAAVEKISALLPGDQARVGGSAVERAEMHKLMQRMLYVVIGLLGVAVLIALVGIGNTLGLSVLERGRESGLLRALGVTRSQLRRMFGVEALVLAAVGTTTGIVAGIGYGAAAAQALLGSSVTALVVVIPWGRLALVAAVALAAGWLASVVPGRRAAKVSPSKALAAE
ncbi:putative ABC transport system permease protein [Austwickia chelonae]|uniref:Putative ABC transporter permease protein n=1 Tax=Austwickia chelonae NBRC 105200 TaxID=1184607 RepID=K6W8V8_9MICO|nr:FtsX-like permease family protein [Austwickia chelonae]GAB78262.1 putative ABC transporter permease protein [Austwickia chelonae NBRC 105200]SEV99908.1 putative ABC transport system permease protein [Austwickia chelonae]